MSDIIVKPLEWQELRPTDDNGFAQDAYSPIGHYIATEDGWFLVGQTQWADAFDLEHAKAAAQADFDARIRSAIERKAEPVAKIGELLSDENGLEDAAKAAFTKAQSVYRADHDHFPLKHTWETTFEGVREGWRAIAYAAVEAAVMPTLGTQPEPRHIRSCLIDRQEAIEGDTVVEVLEEIRKAVFGDVGDEPDVYSDYDRCSELAGKMRRAIAALSAAKEQQP